MIIIFETWEEGWSNEGGGRRILVGREGGGGEVEERERGKEGEERGNRIRGIFWKRGRGVIHPDLCYLFI